RSAQGAAGLSPNPGSSNGMARSWVQCGSASSHQSAAPPWPANQYKIGLLRMVVMLDDVAQCAIDGRIAEDIPGLCESIGNHALAIKEQLRHFAGDRAYRRGGHMQPDRALENFAGF